MRAFADKAAIQRFVTDITELAKAQTEREEWKEQATQRRIARLKRSQRLILPGVLEMDPVPKTLSIGGYNALGAIVDEVCRIYDVSRFDMMSERRSQDIAWPRQVAMYLCITKTKSSYPRVGRYFDRDWTTVIHAVRLVKQVIAEQNTVAE